MSARLLILSDSHGESLSSLLMKAESMGNLDGVIHLGDGYHDLDMFKDGLPPLIQIGGNCDSGLGEQEVLTRQFGAPLLLTHGHLYGVKFGLFGYRRHARAAGARAALFGHTHKPYLNEQDGLLLLNPGSAANGRFAILTVTKDGATAQLY